VLCLIWQAVSVALASFQEQYDLGGLLRFPVGFGSFYALFLIFGLVDASTLLGGFCSLGILAGISVARPDLFAWTLLALASFAAFNILLVRAVLAWLDRWLAKRRSREIISVLFLVGVLSLQLLNPALREPRDSLRLHHGTHTRSALKPSGEAGPWVQRAITVQAWLPPGLAAGTLEQSAQHQPIKASGALGLLLMYVLGTGGLLALRLGAEYRGESLGEAPRAQRATTIDKGWITGGGPIAAVFEKELRTLTRSLPQLYSVLVPALMVFVIGGLFRNGAAITKHPFPLAFPICVAYGLLGFTQLMYNNLGTEGKGIQMLFLIPTPLRTVMLAKNLFHAILYGLVGLTSGVLASLRLGRPNAMVIASTLAWFAFALPANLAAGNLLSITMAYRINLGRIGRQSGSQANGLLSMLIQTTVLGLGSGVISLCTMLDKLWLIAPLLLGLAGLAVIAWVQTLRHADAMANERRDSLIAKLAKTE
jgi:ABC-2 type transport system permease protein